MINGHGDDLHLFNVDIEHNFSSNVYYKGCPQPLLEHLKQHIESIQGYPSPAASELNVMAAKYFGLNENQFLFGNGATEIFYLLAHLYKGKTATIIGPTFSEYEDACSMYQITVFHELWDNIDKTELNTDLVFICNPNNPTGKIYPKKKIEQFLCENPNTQFVIDEAYIEFTTQETSVIDLFVNYKNLIIVKSLTKTFTIPGIRLGYVIAPPHIIKGMEQFKMPWSVNIMACKAGAYIFKHYKQIQFQASVLLAETERFKQQIDTINYLQVQKGYTSYFLVKLKKGTAGDLKKYLVHSHKILIRDATNFVGLEGEYIRLAVQSEAANKTLIKALKQWN